MLQKLSSQIGFNDNDKMLAPRHDTIAIANLSKLYLQRLLSFRCLAPVWTAPVWWHSFSVLNQTRIPQQKSEMGNFESNLTDNILTILTRFREHTQS